MSINNLGMFLFFIGIALLISGSVLWTQKRSDPLKIMVGPIDVTSRYTLQDFEHLRVYADDEEVTISDENGRRLESWRLYR